MDDQELTEFVVGRMARSVGTNDIVRQVCEQSGRSWVEAEAFVRQVEIYRQSQIDRRRAPLWLLLSLATLVGGLGLGTLGVMGLGQTLQVFEKAEGRLTLAVLPALVYQDWMLFSELLLGAALATSGVLSLARSAKAWWGD